MASGRSGHATYYLDVSLVSQNQAGNYSTIRIHFYAIADSGWSGFGSTGWSLSTGHSGTASFNGGSIEFVTVDVNVGHDANGYCSGTISAHSNATGTSTFAGPMDLAQGFSLPRIPKVPSAPGVSVKSVSGRSVTLNVTASGDNGGSAITAYHVAYSFNGGPWQGDKTNWGDPYVNLPPGNYVFSAYATNAVGNSARSQTGTVVIRSGGKVIVGGVAKPALTKVKSAGAMKDATVKVRSGGAWHDAA